MKKLLIVMILLFLLLSPLQSSGYILVSGSSMLPTIQNGSLVSIEYHNTLSYEDIVVLKHRGKQLIKRIIGLPGDSIEIINGNVIRNGLIIKEPYAWPDESNAGCLTVPMGHLYVLGDNRAHSKDSRQIGCISIDTYQGTVILPR